MNEAELSSYCRERGLYAEQISEWRAACEQANDWDRNQNKRLKEIRKADEKRIKALERDLNRKENWTTILTNAVCCDQAYRSKLDKK